MSTRHTHIHTHTHTHIHTHIVQSHKSHMLVIGVGICFARYNLSCMTELKRASTSTQRASPVFLCLLLCHGHSIYGDGQTMRWCANMSSDPTPTLQPLQTLKTQLSGDIMANFTLPSMGLMGLCTALLQGGTLQLASLFSPIHIRVSTKG